MYIFELIGVGAAAVCGAMAAIDKKADAFGVIFLAIISALGGGILRDTLLGHLPPRMFTNFVYVSVSAGCGLLVFLDAYIRREKYKQHRDKLDKIMNILDAVGLAAFTVVSMDIAVEEQGMGNAMLIVALGVTTGVGGGVLRDVLTNSMPKVLRKRVYALASLAGAVLYYFLLYYGASHMAGAVVAMLSIIALRILATEYKWNLPHADV